jgi:hypothetical protein
VAQLFSGYLTLLSAISGFAQLFGYSKRSHF